MSRPSHVCDTHCRVEKQRALDSPVVLAASDSVKLKLDDGAVSKDATVLAVLTHVSTKSSKTLLFSRQQLNLVC